MRQQSKHLYEFGLFRLDARERLLMRDGEVVQIQPKAFDLLLVLVEHHGHLLEKEELLKLVWPDTFVEEGNLSWNVSTLRKALGDGENGQRYIETVPKRGYRFVGQVREVEGEDTDLTAPPQTRAEVATGVTVEASGGPGAILPASDVPVPVSMVTGRKKSLVLALAVLIITIGGISWGIYKLSARNQSQSNKSAPDPKIIPVTTYLGNESQAVFSPDGNQVAFVWGGEQENNPDIYVKLIDAGTPLPLTNNPAPDSNPVWAPDGRHIAFTREGEGGGIYLVPALGGPERKLADAFPSRPFDKQSLSYSPDGKLLAVADKAAADKSYSIFLPDEPYSIFLLDPQRGERRRLTSPPAGRLGDVSPAFSPDGKLLAFARGGIGVQDLYLVPVAGGEPKRLTFDSRRMEGLAWTADGREIIFASRRQTGNIPQLWRIPATGGEPERVATFAQKLTHPAISRLGNRLAYTQNFWDTNIWRIEVPSSAGQRSVPTKFIYSTLEDELAEYSPDGRRIAFISKRSGNWEVWVCQSEGEDPIQITNFGGPVVGFPRWSPDARRLVFSVLQASSAEGHRGLYLINAEGGNLHRLALGLDLDAWMSWSHDGRWIYFVSNRSGSQQIWKIPSEGGQAVQVTKRGGVRGYETPDGQFFYYHGPLGICRMPVAGGEESLILDERQARTWSTWAVVDQGIYFVSAEAPTRPALAFFSFATGKVTEIAALEKSSPLPWSLSVSPNGRWILYTQMDQGSSDIMLMENFR